VKKSGTIFLFVLLITQVIWAQGNEVIYHSDFEKAAFEKAQKIPFELFVASDPSVTANKYNSFQAHLNSIISQLSVLRSKTNNDLRFLEKAFYKIHRRELSWYENYVSLSETLEHKKYDCLTGTALFALILDELSIDYQILEFDFHIFLLANLRDRQVLLEATDPINGFIIDPNLIKERIEHAEYNVEVSNTFNKTYLKNEINLKALAGLQYYNLAVNLFNQQEYKKASHFIQKADLLYSSERIKNTKDLISSASL
jgi:hypothetical protein